MINKVETMEKAVAITFDDGPHPVFTPQVFEIFRKANGKATFFMVGEQMKKHSKIAKQACDLGHEIGNHTYSHPRLPELSKEAQWKEINGTDKLIREITGQKPDVFRPPYLDCSEETALIAAEMGYRAIGAVNLTARDWEQPGANHIFTQSLRCARNGSILLFHDGFGDRSQTIEAVRKLVSVLASRGFHFVTVSELLTQSK